MKPSCQSRLYQDQQCACPRDYHVTHDRVSYVLTLMMYINACYRCRSWLLKAFLCMSSTLVMDCPLRLLTKASGMRGYLLTHSSQTYINIRGLTFYFLFSSVNAIRVGLLLGLSSLYRSLFLHVKGKKTKNRLTNKRKLSKSFRIPVARTTIWWLRGKKPWLHEGRITLLQKYSAFQLRK